MRRGAVPIGVFIALGASGCWLTLGLEDKEYTLGDGGGPIGTMVEVEHGDLTFSIDPTEVTIAEYKAWLDEGHTPNEVSDPRCSWNTTFTPGEHDGCIAPDVICDTFDLDAEASAHPNRPISCIDWCDAIAYCELRGARLCGGPHGAPIELGQEGPEFVFPDFTVDESEWFFACSGGVGLDFPYGAALDEAACNDEFNGTGELVDVGTATCEGGFVGIFDMAGNVEEWVDACFPEVDGDANCLRAGGAYYSSGENDTSLPSCNEGLTIARNCHSNGTGFRCCAG